MPRTAACFKDEGSANEIERWLNRQKSLGRNVKRHHDVLATSGATVQSTARDDVQQTAPKVARVVTFAATPSGTSAARPLSRAATNSTTTLRDPSLPKPKRLRDSEPEGAVEVVGVLRDARAGSSETRQRTTSTESDDRERCDAAAETNATRHREEVTRRLKRKRAPLEKGFVFELFGNERGADEVASESRASREAANAVERREEVRIAGMTRGARRDPIHRMVSKNPAEARIKSLGVRNEAASVPQWASSEAEKPRAREIEIHSLNRNRRDTATHIASATAPFGEGLGIPRARDEENLYASNDPPLIIGLWRNRPRPNAFRVDPENTPRLYPIPGYLTRRDVGSSKDIFDASTTSRRAFVPKSRAFSEQRAKEVRESAAENKTRRSESRVPLGARGIADHPRHGKKTSYVEDFGEAREKKV